MSSVVKSADRTLAILELLTEHRDGLTLTEIQRSLEFPKSSTYVLLMTMASRGFLEQDPESRRFRVGIRLWQAGQSYVAASDLEKVALPYMESLRNMVNETVHLATLHGIDNVYVAKVDSDQQLRLASRVGVRLPAYATGIGKALLSQLDDSEVKARFADVEFVRYTPQTIVSLPELLTRLQEIRTTGYATDNSEYTPGVFCIAATVSGRGSGARAAISVSIPEVRKTPVLIERTITYVRSTAQQISQRMGCTEAGATSL
ncbi:IclR family transcriptional regulator [Streptomyces blattellae]|uniref:IclR family transcriptional regulator n=1 Tax=Streptomyces blattellae TaxID=2569855 RepID=UPI0012B9C04D|nr:IclR family transcriptional regulator [Streptomyces blattellae]